MSDDQCDPNTPIDPPSNARTEPAPAPKPFAVAWPHSKLSVDGEFDNDDVETGGALDG
jgi:hypothetical protein